MKEKLETKTKALYPELKASCEQLTKEFDLISPARKEELTKLSLYIEQKYRQQEIPQLIVICTHNSRRSHLGQVWLAIGADYYQLPTLRSFSGGTEATAFNLSAIEALRQVGVNVETPPASDSSNPVYALSWKTEMESYTAFSKRYDEAPNPQKDFAAILVCTEADAGCPIVFGAELRLPLPYEDPKAFDGTALESQMYLERCRQIGREMLFVMSQVKI